MPTPGIIPAPRLRDPEVGPAHLGYALFKDSAGTKWWNDVPAAFGGGGDAFPDTFVGIVDFPAVDDDHSFAPLTGIGLNRVMNHRIGKNTSSVRFAHRVSNASFLQRFFRNTIATTAQDTIKTSGKQNGLQVVNLEVGIAGPVANDPTNDENWAAECHMCLPNSLNFSFRENEYVTADSELVPLYIWPIDYSIVASDQLVQIASVNTAPDSYRWQEIAWVVVGPAGQNVDCTRYLNSVTVGINNNVQRVGHRQVTIGPSAAVGHPEVPASSQGIPWKLVPGIEMVTLSLRLNSRLPVEFKTLKNWGRITLKATTTRLADGLVNTLTITIDTNYLNRDTIDATGPDGYIQFSAESASNAIQFDRTTA